MATYTAAYADIRINDAGRFRTQMGWIATQLETIGWTKTADTGQIDFSTVLAPGAADTKMGYEIRTNGTLYFKIEYGSGYAAYCKALWFTFGPATDGAGTITTPYSSVIQVRTALGYSGGSARAGDDFVSGDSTRFTIAVTDDTNALYGGECCLEATADLDGDPDGLGWHFTKVNHNVVGDTRIIAYENPGAATTLGCTFLPRAIGSAGVYVPISNVLAPHPINGCSTLRDVIVAPTSLVAHQATLSVGGRTYLSGYGNTTSTDIFGGTYAYACSVLMRYD